MRELFSIKDSTENKITFFHLACFLAALPFDRIYSELVLISLLIHTLIHIKPHAITRSVFKKMIAPAAIYLTVCLGTIYSHYTERAFFEWEILLALILFHLFLLSTHLTEGTI